MTLKGSGFHGIQVIEFVLTGTGMGGRLMEGFGLADTNVKVSNVQANSTGTQITASGRSLPAAATGVRQVRLQTSYGTVMGMMTNAPFNITK